MTEPILDEHGRPEPAMEADEATTLLGFLNWQRSTLEWKVRGLDDKQLSQPLAPSAMTLAGLLGHMGYVEDFWFSTVLARSAPPQPWDAVDWQADTDWDWHQDPASSRQLWEQSKQRTDALLSQKLAEPGALAATSPLSDGRENASLRWILAHMIEEYARHNGHADLLREAIDGQTGE